MSDFAASNDPEHECGDACQPVVPLLYRELEDLEESEHIDALYEVLNLAREHAALVLLALARSGADVHFMARSAAVLLDLDEEELTHEQTPGKPFTASDVVDYAIKAHGEDGYVGQAMETLFRLQLDGS